MEIEPSGYNGELEQWLFERAELLKQSIREELMRRRIGKDLRGVLQWPELKDSIVEISDAVYSGKMSDLTEPNRLDFSL